MPTRVISHFIPTSHHGSTIKQTVSLHSGYTSGSIRSEDAAVGETAFNTVLRKGHLLSQAFIDTDSPVAQRQFSKPVDLQKWGYRTIPYDEYYDFDKSLPIRSALRGVNVSDKTRAKGGPNRAFLLVHEETTVHRGKSYPTTNASFHTIFNLDDGVIISWGAFSPAHAGPKQDPPVFTLPRLRQWSDITYLQWAHLHTGSRLAVSHLRYIFVTPCINSTTQLVISKSLKSHNRTLTKWPGVTFNMDSTAGKAILGTPNGYGVAFLLIQHKRQLGNKRVSKVTIFEDEGLRPLPRPPSLLFWIEDVAP